MTRTDELVWVRHIEGWKPTHLSAVFACYTSIFIVLSGD